MIGLSQTNGRWRDETNLPVYIEITMYVYMYIVWVDTLPRGKAYPPFAIPSEATRSFNASYVGVLQLYVYREPCLFFS